MSKGGLISESFSLFLKSPKNVPNHYPEYLFFRWILLRIFLAPFSVLNQNIKTFWDEAIFSCETQRTLFILGLEIAFFGFVKFRVCLKEVCNISFKPEFGNPSFEIPENYNVLNFQLTCFSAIVDFILWFCTSPSNETWSFELIYQFLLFKAQRQRRFSIQAIQNLGSNST